MKIILPLIGIFFFSNLLSQDGSNIRYYEPNSLKNRMVGKLCHIDFGEISFGGQSVDTMEVFVNGQQIKFYEHRVDDGLNNWFSEQYLIAVTSENQPTIRLKNSRIDRFTKRRIYITSTLGYYYQDSPLDTITVIKHSYERKSIAKVLIKD